MSWPQGKTLTVIQIQRSATSRTVFSGRSAASLIYFTRLFACPAYLNNTILEHISEESPNYGELINSWVLCTTLICTTHKHMKTNSRQDLFKWWRRSGPRWIPVFSIQREAMKVYFTRPSSRLDCSAELQSRDKSTSWRRWQVLLLFSVPWVVTPFFFTPDATSIELGMMMVPFLAAFSAPCGLPLLWGDLSVGLVGFACNFWKDPAAIADDWALSKTHFTNIM